MPGHGDPIVQTFPEWMIRIQKRVARLERRQSRAASIPDSGWSTTIPTPAAGVTISQFAIRQYGQLVQLRIVATIASISIPVTGDVVNTTLFTLAAELRPTQLGTLSNAGFGRASGGVVNPAGTVQLSAVAPDATQTASVAATNLQISLGGMYLLG